MRIAAVSYILIFSLVSCGEDPVLKAAREEGSEKSSTTQAASSGVISSGGKRGHPIDGGVPGSQVGAPTESGTPGSFQAGVPEDPKPGIPEEPTPGGGASGVRAPGTGEIPSNSGQGVPGNHQQGIPEEPAPGIPGGPGSVVPIGVGVPEEPEPGVPDQVLGEAAPQTKGVPEEPEPGIPEEPTPGAGGSALQNNGASSGGNSEWGMFAMDVEGKGIPEEPKPGIPVEPEPGIPGSAPPSSLSNPTPGVPGEIIPGQPTQPSVGIPEDPTPFQEGGDRGSSAPVTSGPMMTLRGRIVFPDYRQGPIRVDIFDGDQLDFGGNGPSIVAKVPLDKPGIFEVQIPVSKKMVWLSAFNDENMDGRPSPMDPTGHLLTNPVLTTKGDQLNLNIALERRTAPEGGDDL